MTKGLRSECGVQESNPCTVCGGLGFLEQSSVFPFVVGDAPAICMVVRVPAVFCEHRQREVHCRGEIAGQTEEFAHGGRRQLLVAPMTR